MRSLLYTLAILGCSLLFSSTLRAQEVDHGQDARATEPDTAAGKMLARVLKMFEGDKEAIGEDDLSESFLNAVPIEKLRQVTSQIRAAEGSLKLDSIDKGATDKALVANVIGSKKATPLRILLNLDAAGKIEGLLIQPGVDKRVPELKSWEDLKERLDKSAEKAACAVNELSVGYMNVDGITEPSRRISINHLESRVSIHAEDPLAIGSAFKLWVLGALGSLMEDHRTTWDEPLRIEESLKSLPSGVMQNERDGKEFPTRTFADKMISISDNTATDRLIHRIGREQCEQFMTDACGPHIRNIPLLTTRDLFVLKLTPGNELPEKYLAADTAARRAMLEPPGEVATGTPQITLAAAWKAPRYIDKLEWFASASDMAKTLSRLDEMSRVKGLESIRDILSINPGIPMDKKVWTYVGFKGGSEPGVLSLNWLLERADGRRFVVSFILNDTKKAIDEGKAIALAGRVVEFLGKWDVKEK